MDEQMVLVIFDTFRGHKVVEMESLLLRNNILSVVVPSNCKDLLQPLDFFFNKPLKDHLRNSFQTWYSEQVPIQLQEGKEPEDVKVDTRLSVMKPLSAKWITAAYDHLRSDSGFVHSGFVEAGIVEALEEAETKEHLDNDPFADLD